VKKPILAAVLGGALVASTAAGALAQPGDPVRPVVIAARSDITEGGIPPNPVVPASNHGIYVASVAIPTDPIIPD
jgi:hypothetical protein